MQFLISLIQSWYVQRGMGNLFHALWLAAVMLCLIYTIERLTGERTSQYQTGNFCNDLVFWFYYQSGVHDYLLYLVLFSLLQEKLAFLRSPWMACRWRSSTSGVG
jgi:hypothetical protein